MRVGRREREWGEEEEKLGYELTSSLQLGEGEKNLLLRLCYDIGFPHKGYLSFFIYIPLPPPITYSSSILSPLPPFLLSNHSEFLPLYLSDERAEMLDFFPLLRYYRDVVFTFKYLMAPDAAAFPPPRPYLPASARLRWGEGGMKKGSGRGIEGNWIISL